MKTDFRIRHEFVETMPPQREEGVLYVSIPFSTAVHNCFCGCGTKVVTPIKPAGWELTYDGDTVSLWPSVGSWGLPCRSHYIIRKDMVTWAGDMSQERIDQGREHDRRSRERYYSEAYTQLPARKETVATGEAGQPLAGHKAWWQRLLGL